MALPKVTITQVDGSLNLAPVDTSGICVKIGTASAGVIGELTSWASDQDAKSYYQSGKLLDAISVALAVGGKSPVYAMRMAASVAGSVAAVQATLKPNSDGVLATSGSSPLDDYNVVITITRAGKVGTSPYPAFTYSLDDGISTSDEISVPIAGSYVIPNTGITLVFSNGATGFIVGDVFKFSTVGATWNNTDLSAALTSLFAVSNDFEFIHVVGPCDSTLASTVSSYVIAAENDPNNKRYVHAIVEAKDMEFQAKLISPAITFPLNPAGGETLKIDISTDFGTTFATTRTFTFAAGAIASINALVTLLNTQSFTSGLFAVSAGTIANTLQIDTFSNKGKVQLKVNNTSTACPGLIPYVLGTVAAGQTEDNWMNTLSTDFIAFNSARVSVVAGHADIYSPISKRYLRRSSAWVYSGWLSAISISTHPGQVDLGALPLILTKNISLGRYGIYHDENLKPGLDSARFTTLRSVTGLSGFYITRGRIMTNPGSDFQYVQFRRVIDIASKLAFVGATKFLNKKFRVNGPNEKFPGAIYPPDAVPVEKNIQSYILSNMGSEITSASVTIDKTTNFLSTGILNITIAIVPFGYAEEIKVKIGYAPVAPSV